MAGPTPILSIPIDDAAFKRFFDTFKKYQDQVKEQPEMWKGMSDGVDHLAVAAATMTEEIVRQTEETRKLADEEAKRDKAHETAAQRRKKEEADEDRREQRAHDARKRQIDQVREYGRAASNTVSGLGKWAAGGSFGGLASAAGEGALGLSALGAIGGLAGGVLSAVAAGAGASYIANSVVGNRRQTAIGLGTTPGKVQGYEKALQYDFDVDPALDKMSKMQNDPAALSMWGMAGITNPKDMDTAELLKRYALYARSQWIKDGKNTALAEAHGYGKVFSVNELRNMTANDLEGDFAKGDKFAKIHGQSDDVGTAAQKLVVQFDLLGAKISNGLLAELTSLDPILMRIVNEANGLADALSMFDKTKASPMGLLNGGKYKNAWDYLGDAVGGGAGKWIKNNMGAEGDGDAGNGGGVVGGSAKRSLFPNSLGKPYAGWTPWANSGGAGDAGAGAGGGSTSLAALELSMGLPSGVLTGIYGTESAFGKNAGKSSAGALGPMQFMPGTAKRYGITDRTDFGQSSRGAARYMADLMKMFAGDEVKALAAYNWGEGNVQSDIAKHGDDWLSYAPSETQNYVRKVLAIQAGGGRKAKPSAHRSQVHVKISNQTGASVATSVNAAAG